jgi:hypothetical protein
MKKISRVSVILLTQTRKLVAFLNSHYPTITIISIDILNHTLLIKSYHGTRIFYLKKKEEVIYRI